MKTQLFRRCRARGYTLIEMICALTIFVICAIGIFSLLVMSVELDSESQHYSLARATAQQQIETARAYGIDNLSSVAQASASAMPPQATETISIVNPYNSSQDLSEFTVAISWPEARGVTDSVVISTCISRTGLSAS